MMNSFEFHQYCINQHDVVCNQKYDRTLPYSFHLEAVRNEAHGWNHILPLTDDERHINLMVAMGHDLIEDARVTYNDIKEKVGYEVAEAIFALTEDKGRNRLARHSRQYYIDIADNPHARLVKLCDILSNVKYSLFTNSSMLDKYRSEWITVGKIMYFNEDNGMNRLCDRINDILYKIK